MTVEFLYCFSSHALFLVIHPPTPQKLCMGCDSMQNAIVGIFQEFLRSTALQGRALYLLLAFVCFLLTNKSCKLVSLLYPCQTLRPRVWVLNATHITSVNNFPKMHLLNELEKCKGRRKRGYFFSFSRSFMYLLYQINVPVRITK